MERLEKLLNGECPSHIRPFVWMKGEELETVREEFDRIEECGIREICLESRPHPDFCGAGWWRDLDFIFAEARRRNFRVWILDDDKFPTGHANGGFIRQPEKKKVYLAERHMDILGPCKSNAVLAEPFLQPDGKLLAILAVPKPDGRTDAVSMDGVIDLTDQYANGFVYFDLPKGAYRLFVLFTTRSGGGREDYMNLIDAESVQVLIEEVYEKHYTHYKQYFGNTFAGFFSDEPELGNVKGYPFDASLGQKNCRLPWSRQLEQLLREKWGSRFLISLPALWYECGARTAGVRSDYMEELTGLVTDCFSGQIGSWCSRHGVEYIGHIIEDDNAHTRLGCSIGHYFREMEGQHMAGIDVVHHQIVPGFTEPVHQWIAGDRDGEFFHFGLAKLASSAADIQENKKGRALCEIFGNYGWAEGNSLMKWLTNHMLVRGINEFTPHAFSMQYPDPDCPPHFYARGNNPGFACFARLMRYMNRSAHLLSGGTPVKDAAVLYHAEAEWCSRDAMFFQIPGRRLMERQLDYDVLPADILRRGSARVQEGELVCGRMHYPCLILPKTRYLDAETGAFAADCAEKGLPVFLIDAVPKLDTQNKPLPEGWDRKLKVVKLSGIADEAEKVSGRKLTVRGRFPELRGFVTQTEDGLCAMYFNESVSRSVQTVIAVSDEKYDRVTVYDPWNNRAERYLLQNGEIPLCLERGEAVFFVLDKREKDAAEKPFPRFEDSRKLCMDWKLSCRGVQENCFRHKLTIKAGARLPNVNGPGCWPDFVGTWRYEGSFSYQKKAGRRYRLRLPEASDSVRVFVNGTDCGWLTGFPARTEITDCLCDGRNELVLEAVTTPVWKIKDGASTHLQIAAAGITEEPVLECSQTEE